MSLCTFVNRQSLKSQKSVLSAKRTKRNKTKNIKENKNEPIRRHRRGVAGQKFVSFLTDPPNEQDQGVGALDSPAIVKTHREYPAHIRWAYIGVTLD